MSSNNETQVIGLTGGIGTGKSTAAKYLVSRGMVHIDADAISRQITEKDPDTPNPVLEEIGLAFDTNPGASPDSSGSDPQVLREDGSLDRQAMAQIVFSDPAKKKLLEDILFRHIIREIHRQIDAAQGQSVLLDVPLLFESGLDSLCDKVIVVKAEPQVRIRRVMERDGCSAEDVEARIRNQMPEEEKIARADFAVDNSSTRQDLERQLDQVLLQLGIDKS